MMKEREKKKNKKQSESSSEKERDIRLMDKNRDKGDELFEGIARLKRQDTRDEGYRIKNSYCRKENKKIKIKKIKKKIRE